MKTELRALFKGWENNTNLERDRLGNKREYRLDRMAQLCSLFDHPENHGSIIHLAGSKGKGSTAVMCASILHQGGYKVGLYSSPHLIEYTERFRLFPETLENQDLLINLGEKINNTIKDLNPGRLKGGDIPTTFEILTLLAFLYFRESNCDWIIIETGLGGRLDATNVVNPQAVILTPIELEHQDFLGDTLEKISHEKAGIIKEKIPVFSAFQSKEADQVFRKKCEETGSLYFTLSEILESCNYQKDNYFQLNWNNKGLPERCSLSMAGPVQGYNAALSILCLNHLIPDLSHSAIKRGLKEAFLPARGEIIQKNPLILLDGAHTAISMKNMVNTLKDLSKPPYRLLFGCALDKDINAIGDVLKEVFDEIIITTPGTFKASDPPGIYDCFKDKGLPVTLIHDSSKAINSIYLSLKKNGGGLLIAGSFYLAGIASSWLSNNKKKTT